MLPPKASGTRAERTSRLAGATPTVPCIGFIGSSAVKSLSLAVNWQLPFARSSSQIQTTSGSGSCRVAVRWVDVSAPNNGTVVDAAHARLGALDMERPGLRVQERELADLGDQVLLATDSSREAVLGPQFQHYPWLYPGDRGGAAECPGVLLYLGPE